MPITSGWKRQPAGYRFETADYDLLQVIAVTGGCVRFRSGTTDAAVRHGGVLLLRPGSAFTLGCDADGGEGYRGVFAIRRGGAASDTGPSLVLRGSPEIVQVVALMEAELDAAPGDAGAVLPPLAEALLGLAVRLGRQQRRGGAHARDRAYWAERVRTRIETRLFTGEPVGAVLDGLGLSARQLARHFRAETGMSPKRYQLVRRMDHAAELLRNTRLPVTDIALELGFPSAQHFATQFARAFGAPPSAFRRA